MILVERLFVVNDKIFAEFLEYYDGYAPGVGRTRVYCDETFHCDKLIFYII